ncbi:MAG: GNAT family N-acetyltransferase [Allomuricauda sp.]
MLHYSDGESCIALPILLRDIEGTDFKDATSVYGYVGPIGNNIGDGFNNQKFRKFLDEFLMDNQIVSVFSRLHPFIDEQKIILKNIGKIVPHGKVVNIDLTLNLDEQRKQYNRRLRTYINKASKEYEIMDGNCYECLDIFIKMYCENMKRVDAKPSYFFGKTYFYEFLASSQINSELLVAKHKETGEIAGGALFTKNGNTIQYHLSGVKSEFTRLNPIKLLIDHVRIEGTKQGFANFNLGGGLGGKTEDSLFYFKSGFSNDYREFNTWQYIVDDVKYNDLLKQNLEMKRTSIDENSCYFPLYRHNVGPDDIEISQINCLANDR